MKCREFDGNFSQLRKSEEELQAWKSYFEWKSTQELNICGREGKVVKV